MVSACLRSQPPCCHRIIVQHKLAARSALRFQYHGDMDKQEHLERHLKLFQDIYERMKREGTWPWPDSPKSEDVIESDDNTNDA
mgnify:CR=1 FL=1